MEAGYDPGAAHSHIHDPWLVGSHHESERQGGHTDIMEETSSPLNSEGLVLEREPLGARATVAVREMQSGRPVQKAV